MNYQNLVDLTARIMAFAGEHLYGILLAIALLVSAVLLRNNKMFRSTLKITIWTVVIITLTTLVLLTMSTVNLILLGVCLAGIVLWVVLNERIFIQIPQNHVAAVFRSGIRVKYVVATEEDKKKLTEVTVGGVLRKNECVEQGKYKVELATAIPFITELWNIRIYSFNPFAKIMPVEILKNYWKTRGELAEEENAHPQHETGVSDKVKLARQPSSVRFLRIDSVVIGLDENVELRGNMQVTYSRQTNVRAWDLDEIYLTQHGRYSGYVDETIRAAHMAFLNTLAYNKDETASDGTVIKNFQDMDLSENEGNPFNKAIRDRISGNFGSIVLTTAVNDWELSEASREIIAAVDRATASEHDLKVATNKAKGEAAKFEQEGLAKSKGEKALLEVYAEIAKTPAGVAAMQLRQTEIATENLGSGTATRVITFGSGGAQTILPTLAIPADPPQLPTPPAPAPQPTTTPTPPVPQLPPTGTP